MSACQQRKNELGTLAILQVIIAQSTRKDANGDWRVPIQAVHQALAEARNKYPDLLRGVPFSKYSLSPYSPAVESALASLGAAGLVTVENPRFKWLKVAERDREAFLDNMKKVDPNALNELKEVIETFDAEVEKYINTSSGVGTVV